MSAAFADLLLSDFLRCKYKCYLRLTNMFQGENSLEQDRFNIESHYKIIAYDYFRKNHPMSTMAIVREIFSMNL